MPFDQFPPSDLFPFNVKPRTDGPGTVLESEVVRSGAASKPLRECNYFDSEAWLIYFYSTERLSDPNGIVASSFLALCLVDHAREVPHQYWRRSCGSVVCATDMADSREKGIEGPVGADRRVSNVIC